MKYLGVIFDSNPKWDTHILKTCGKARKLLDVIQYSLISTDHITELGLFNEIVLSILEYARHVWSPHAKGLIKQLDMVDRHGINWIYHIERLDIVSHPKRFNNIISPPWRTGAIRLTEPS